MRKSGAGVLWFCLGVILSGPAGMGGRAAVAQEPAAVPEGISGTFAPAEAAKPPVDIRAQAQARLNELKGLAPEEIEQIVLRSEQALAKLNEEARTARLATRDLQEKMRLENPDVRAKYREIDELRAKIDAFINELPEVKALLDVENQARENLLTEAWFRTEAMGLVAQKDRAAGFPARPEPVPAETAPAPDAAPAAAATAPDDLEQ